MRLLNNNKAFEGFFSVTLSCRILYKRTCNILIIWEYLGNTLDDNNDDHYGNNTNYNNMLFPEKELLLKMTSINARTLSMLMM